MNKIFEILDKYKIENRPLELDSVEWLTQKSQSRSILFYNFLNKSEEEIIKFKQRIAGTQYGICLTNLDHPHDSDHFIFHLDQISYENIKKELLAAIYPLDLKNIKFLGVTGTNGKTTVLKLVEQLYLQQKQNILTIGTLGIFLNQNQLEQDHLITSLSYIDLHKLLFQYQKKISVVMMEMTSHGLDQGRYGDLRFDAIAWTNLTQDHLDYHKTMENYFLSKLKIYNHLKKNGEVLLPSSQNELIKKIGKTLRKVKYDNPINNPFFKVNYNLDNLALAIGLLEEIIDKNKLNPEILLPPDGRFNILKYKDSFIIIDYAHSPDGLESICREIKKNFSDKKLVTLFGCGGDRDKTKRPLMGVAASKYSDYLILTSDNPRMEDPEKIIDDIVPGVDIKYTRVVNRKSAVEEALKNLKDSVLLIAGKGHENYIDQMGVKSHYNDLETVENFIKGRN